MSRIVILRLLDTYFRHRWLYLIPIGVMVIAAAVYILNQNLYISSGVIFTDRDSLLSSLTSLNQEAVSWNTPAQDTANQVSQLITTDAFIRAVISNTDLETEMSKGTSTARDTISDVRSQLWVSVTGNNQVQIGAAHTDPHIAYQLAQSTINTFILWNINLNHTDSATATGFFQDLIPNYQADVLAAQDALRSYLVAHPEPLRGSRPATEQFDIVNLQDQLEFAQARLNHALEKAEDARLANAQIESNIRQKYTVVDAPAIPDRSTTSKRKIAMNSAIFLAVGVLLSGIAIVGTTLLDQSFRIPEDVPQLLNIPMLAFLPDTSPSAPRHYRGWKRRRSILSAGDEHLEEKSVEALTLAAPAQELPASVSVKPHRDRKKKKDVTTEPTDIIEPIQDQTPNVIDLSKPEDDSKPEQNV
jgi:capsular polysaccharide biosynthesis protein